MRNEIKVPLNNKFDLNFSSWKDLTQNIVKTFDDRKVHSIYFDTPDFITARDNLAGISSRKKYRLRWYNDDFQNQFYEIKSKKNNLGSKIVLKSNKEDIRLKDAFSFKNSFLQKENKKYFLEYINYFNLEPKLEVSYLRSYYTFKNNVRITYDRKINYKSIDGFNLKAININDHMNVIEIKFDPKDFKAASELIKKSRFIPKRFSKYLRGLYLSGNAIYI